MNSGQPTTPATANEEEVFNEVVGMLQAVLGDYGLDEAGITMDTRFHEDLDLESIDLVTLGGHLEARYGDTVNFAEYLAGLGLEQIINLSIGRLVEHVAACLRDSEEH
ncbi:acyl carrier protein [Streptomyces sp. Je 1-4]|uniref:acyl carrier protein n=1 Tax=Streptomyces TaxID=1883 RepID=UPI0021DB6D2F|nr:MULTISPECIES: phosphopantetheine-binding protein [unclassified Streptomyces]UYB43947.1 acyl carrier protein [Streptomyces sp. Je 1-4]UZQ40371.1 acyl carrier protein [Streptomyces sp. Je 1-4] [Streptomyces sp. Je 1-4 4N24]UZQ47788.1 acyl carrier protein [Streptomyces sp. Je 1-4] [Streptomyces sp. Je 1-4 4N24_ara]